MCTIQKSERRKNNSNGVYDVGVVAMTVANRLTDSTLQIHHNIICMPRWEDKVKRLTNRNKCYRYLDDKKGKKCR